MAASFGTTIDYVAEARFAAPVRLAPRPAPTHPAAALRLIAATLRLARQERWLLLPTSWGRLHADMLATMLLGLWPGSIRPSVVLVGCMWEPNGGMRALVERLVIRLGDRAARAWVVQSSEEMELFPRLWGVSAAKMRRCLYYAPMTRAAAPPGAVSDGGYVLGVGNSLRDYAPLLAAARQLPEHRFVFATHLLDRSPELPPNVETGQVSSCRYEQLLRGASVVVVPVRADLWRAAGQQSYLDAMWLGKAVVVPATLGVRDHIQHGETGLIVDGSAAGYAGALRSLLGPAHRADRERIGQGAHCAVREHFTFDHHVRRLLQIMTELQHA